MIDIEALSLVGIMYCSPKNERVKLIIGVDPKEVKDKLKVLEILQGEFKGSFSVNIEDLRDMTILLKDIFEGRK